jgi:hypothetical protein
MNTKHAGQKIGCHWRRVPFTLETGFCRQMLERRAAPMITTNAFGVGVAALACASASVAGAAKASHAGSTAAAMAAAGKHRVAAATDASVNRGHT